MIRHIVPLSPILPQSQTQKNENTQKNSPSDRDVPIPLCPLLLSTTIHPVRIRMRIRMTTLAIISSTAHTLPLPNVVVVDIVAVAGISVPSSSSRR